MARFAKDVEYGEPSDGSSDNCSDEWMSPSRSRLSAWDHGRETKGRDDVFQWHYVQTKQKGFEGHEGQGLGMLPSCSLTGRRLKRGTENLKLTQEEEARRRTRRERNKQAAARCRQRRVDLTNRLLAETESLEEEKAKLETEVAKLQRQRNQLEYVLGAHASRCPVNIQQTAGYRGRLGLQGRRDDEPAPAVVKLERTDEDHFTSGISAMPPLTSLADYVTAPSRAAAAVPVIAHAGSAHSATARPSFGHQTGYSRLGLSSVPEVKAPYAGLSPLMASDVSMPYGSAQLSPTTLMTL